LLNEVVNGLDLKPGHIVVDATIGLGGHTVAILEKTKPNGLVIGFDRDARNIKLAKERLSDVANRIRFINASFGQMNEYVKETVDAVLFDLGFSSLHVDDPSRGFSFLHDGQLDMRYDQSQDLTAEVIVNSWSKDDLCELFRKLGEENFAPQITKAIFEARRKQRITSTAQLADIISSVVRRSGKQHPATKVFQALRIAVNDELGEIKKGLDGAVSILKTGGKMAVISFHSLEDREIKNYFKKCDKLSAITKKPIRPSIAEIKSNPRARSAKLRIARKE
jgi:16S rRNA (cytosine1402-N4)-methyltransferase